MYEDAKTDFVIMRVTSAVQRSAEKWATELVVTIIQYLRRKERAKGEWNIAYLNDQALQSELQNEMMARETHECIFRIVGHSVASERRSISSLLPWLSGRLLAGIFVAPTLDTLKFAKTSFV
jgi:hypothetical protein